MTRKMGEKKITIDLPNKLTANEEQSFTAHEDSLLDHTLITQL